MKSASAVFRGGLCESTLMYSCMFCSGFLGHSFKKLLSHIKFIHSHKPNFAITCSDCGQSFRKVNSFKTHIRRERAKKALAEHPEEADTEVDNDSEQDSDEEQGTQNYVADVTKFLALFILKTKEENQLSQQTIDAIFANTEDVVESSVQCLKDKIRKCLAKNEIEIEAVDGLGDILEEPCVFSRAKEPLANEYLQVKYFLENFDLVVSSSFSKLLYPIHSIFDFALFLSQLLWSIIMEGK